MSNTMTRLQRSGAVSGLIIAVLSLATTAMASPLLVPEDLEATLFASEPMLSSPSDIDIDSKGRVWVCEVLNYRGKQETREQGDRILVLEDTDGDGKADEQTVFHQGRDVDSALGICVIGEGPGRRVIVSCAPDVFIFHDDDGDLKADRRESLFTNTGVRQHDHSVHAFVVGPDGRWYFNFGNTGRAVHDKEGKPVHDRFGNAVNDSGNPWRQGMVFRCKPDGSDFEVLGHNFRNNYEVAVDSFGSLWQSDNDDDGNRSVRINYVMEYGNFGYKNEVNGAGWRMLRTNLEADVPLQHWHQNDPGVVPNLLHTGAGSPTGICVYEGHLLPERFYGAILHCDAGPNVVRAYHVKPAGAGYSAAVTTLVDGSADRWFRPSDICVAPDGSLIVADWHDPGVGGHGMADTEKGRLYRIAPKASRDRVAASTKKVSPPVVDMGSIAGAVESLSSPNLCTRAMALEKLSSEPVVSAAELAEAFEKQSDLRLRARLAWAAGMLPGHAELWIDRLARQDDEHLRIMALRICRLTTGDVLGLVEKLSSDPSIAVRRDASIALRGIAGERADRAWAALAAQHQAGDRWEVEALGVGADGAHGMAGPRDWDGRLAAWLARVNGQWKTPAGREIIWRSRAAATPQMLCELIGDPSITTSESLALVRALDFQEPARTAAAVTQCISRFNAPDEKLRVILPELVARLDAGSAADGGVGNRVDEAAGYAAGTRAFVEIVRRFGLERRWPEVAALAAADSTPDQLATEAAAAVLDAGRHDVVQAVVAAGGSAAARLLEVIGINGSAKSLATLESLVAAPEEGPEIKIAAVRGLARSQPGARHVVAMAKAGKLTGVLPQVAAVAIATCPWVEVKQAAADVLPMPKTKGGQKLPPVSELLKRTDGNAKRGKAVFVGAGTCVKCHIVGSEGKSVGPNLSEIGGKLSRQAMYEAILAPSAAISHNYETFTALLEDGRSVTGLLVSQSPSEVVIKGPDGIDMTIAADDVDELVKQPISLMPADLAATLSIDELVDLVAWLETLKATN